MLSGMLTNWQQELKRSAEFKAIGKYLHPPIKPWCVISYPCPNFDGGVAKPLFKLGHEMDEYI